MNKELNAVISLRTRLVEKGIKDEFLEELIVIETAIKENANLKKMIRNFNETIGEPQIISPNIEKKLKALEIIKDKGCSGMEIALIVSCKNYEEYCFEMNSGILYSNGYERGKAFKTKEEYDILKEVLL